MTTLGPMQVDADGLPVAPNTAGGYRDPAQVPPSTARYYIVYQKVTHTHGGENMLLVQEEWDTMEGVQQRIITLHQKNESREPPLVFYGHLKRPAVDVQRVYTVEWK